MKLIDYLEEKDLSAKEFAVMVGVARSTVYEWISGRFKPRFDSMKQIKILTKGKVTEKDF